MIRAGEKCGGTMKKRQLIGHLDTSDISGMGLAEQVIGSRGTAAPDPDDCYPIQHRIGLER